MTGTKEEHERIWLEPAGAPDRCWRQDNVWGDEAVEYVRVDLLSPAPAPQVRGIEDAAKLVEAELSGMEFDKFSVNGRVLTNSKGHDLFLSVEEIRTLLRNRAAQVRALAAKDWHRSSKPSDFVSVPRDRLLKLLDYSDADYVPNILFEEFRSYLGTPSPSPKAEGIE